MDIYYLGGMHEEFGGYFSFFIFKLNSFSRGVQQRN